MPNQTDRDLLTAVTDSYDKQIFEINQVLKHQIFSVNLFFTCHKKDGTGGFFVQILIDKHSGIPDHVRQFLYQHLSYIMVNKQQAINTITNATNAETKA